MNKSQWCSAGLIATAVVVGAMAWLQRESAELLRTEVAGLQSEAREVARLRADNARLRAAQPPAEEIARLRADHAAVERLRRELEVLRTDVEKREQAIAASPPRAAIMTAAVASSAAPEPRPVPVAVLPVAITLDGAMTLNDQPTDLGALRARLATFKSGDLFEVRLLLPDARKDANLTLLEQRIEGFRQLARDARDLGLKMNLQLEQPAFVTRTAR